MRSTGWIAIPIALLLFAGPTGCGNDEPDEGTTIIHEDDDDPDAVIEVDEDDEGFEMDVEVDEEGNVTGEVQVDEDEP